MYPPRSVADVSPSTPCSSSATPPDDGDVEVRLDAGQATARLVVEGQGGGVADSELDRIFEPFYRSKQHATRAQQSGGLGLAIAARAIALNGGTIKASNSAGGLRVDIRLPLAS